MLKNIPWSQVAAIVIGGIILTIINAKLTKKVTKADGSTVSYVGSESTGWL